MRHLGKQAIAFTCLGSRAGLLKISTGLVQPRALGRLDITDWYAPLFTTFGCKMSSRFILKSVCCQSFW